MTRSLEDIIKAEEEFSKYHEKLRNELNRVNWHFTILKYIKEIHKDYLKELNQAPAFFSLTIDAHLYATLMRLNRFFDKKEKVKHLHMNSFLNFIEQNLDIFSHQAFERRLRALGRYDERAEKFDSGITAEKVVQDRKKLGDLPISALKDWRNKILAHIDRDYVAKGVDVAKKHPIKIKHTEQIINTLDDMLNEYCLAYDFSTHSKDLTVEQGIQYVLDAIRFERQNKSFSFTPSPPP
jgi:hypothetical protein